MGTTRNSLLHYCRKNWQKIQSLAMKVKIFKGRKDFKSINLNFEYQPILISESDFLPKNMIRRY